MLIENWYLKWKLVFVSFFKFVMSDPKAKGMQKVLARNEFWERFKRNSKRLSTSMLKRYKQIKIENPKRKTLISNTILISSID